MCARRLKRAVVKSLALSVLLHTSAHAEFIKPQAMPTTGLIKPSPAHSQKAKARDLHHVAHAKVCPELFYNAIRSEAMMTALTCGQRDLYTQAVADKHYASQAIARHFRTEGAHLRYTTELANQQSLYDIRHYGKGLCEQRSTLLADMSHTISDPASYVALHDIFIIPEACTKP